ncbi:hypothetical protein KOI35_45605 [Actinoplanes bogorensis]|uniref:Uncharacterized protein n=1 Tax=Paractinoplanes bogorensis TaxID=1610840 RepID=A0ABS5Z5I2_9ACTN|nr:hypothetical protein [Actinoplanes bogorensis]MBU2670801.1 hypothetical protein [Actinoplanes bogorensis]
MSGIAERPIRFLRPRVRVAEIHPHQRPREPVLLDEVVPPARTVHDHAVVDDAVPVGADELFVVARQSDAEGWSTSRS